MESLSRGSEEEFTGAGVGPSSEAESLPSPGQDLSREERVLLSGGEEDEEDAPPCPEEDELDDEWADDNDTGYLLEPITEEEFLEIEEVLYSKSGIVFLFDN